LKFLPQKLVGDELFSIESGSQFSECAGVPFAPCFLKGVGTLCFKCLLVSFADLPFLSHSIQLLRCKVERFEEAFCAEVILKDVKKLACLDFPAGASFVCQDVTNWLFVWSHSWEHRRDSVTNDFAEVTLPFASWARLNVAHAVRVVPHWAIIAPDKVPRAPADRTLGLNSVN
jgi:hypothetical protein